MIRGSLVRFWSRSGRSQVKLQAISACSGEKNSDPDSLIELYNPAWAGVWGVYCASLILVSKFS